MSPSEVQELRGWFSAVDRDNSGEISANELAQMQFGVQKFGMSTCNMLIKVFDTDQSGQIGFFEYCVLHKFIMGMQAAFHMHDKDRSRRLDLPEVTQALAQGGFQFSQATVGKIFSKFAKKSYGKEEGLEFESFIQMCAYLGQIRSAFDLQDTDRDRWIRINLEGLVQVSAPYSDPR